MSGGLKRRMCSWCKELKPVNGFHSHEASCRQRTEANAQERDRECQELHTTLEQSLQSAIDDHRAVSVLDLERARVNGVKRPALDKLTRSLHGTFSKIVDQLRAHRRAASLVGSDNQALEESFDAIAQSWLTGTANAAARKTMAINLLAKDNCAPLKPVQRSYGSYPVRRAKKSSEQDSPAKFSAVVHDLPLEEQLRQRTRDPDFAAKVFSTRQSVDGQISDWWDCKLATGHPHVKPDDPDCQPVHVYTGDLPFPCHIKWHGCELT